MTITNDATLIGKFAEFDDGKQEVAGFIMFVWRCGDEIQVMLEGPDHNNLDLLPLNQCEVTDMNTGKCILLRGEAGCPEKKKD